MVCFIGDDLTKVRRGWASFDHWINDEAVRLSECFDEDGRRLVGDDELLPETEGTNWIPALGEREPAVPPPPLAVKLPDTYVAARESLEFDEINFGIGGIRLEAIADIENEQVGYSVAEDGSSLCDDREGSWQQSWIVIGSETSCGDPIFMDVSNGDLPVLTAIHGVETWEPSVIASSLEAFITSLKEFRRVAKGRDAPVPLEKNPLSPQERVAVLRRISESNGGETDMFFWELLLEG